MSTRTECHDRGCPFRLAELVAPDLVADLMHMGNTTAADGSDVFLYKHADTRRYLNLSAEGDRIAAWRYRCHLTDQPGWYERQPLAAALTHVVS